MAGPLLTVNVVDTEALVQLRKLPRKIQTALMSKLDTMMSDVREGMFHGLPGKYLDPQTIQSGVVKQGALTIIGFIESTDKTGHYFIEPTKTKLLKFLGERDGTLVYTKHVWHPYLKGSPYLARRMAELKPWIEDQLENALIEAL